MSAAGAEHVTIGGLTVRIDRAGWSTAMQRALYGRNFEIGERRACAALLRPGERVLEAGTAVGLVAMTAARIVGGGNVVSYEANPALVRLARSNAAENGLDIDVRHGATVSDERARFSTVSFYQAPDFAASSTMAGDAADEIAVPAVSIRQALAEVGPQAVIIDIEGGEAEIAGDVAASDAGKVILELHPAAIGIETCRAIGDRFTEAGFQVVEPICHGQVVCFARDAGVPAGRFSDSAAFQTLRSLDMPDAEADVALRRAAALRPENAFVHATLARRALKQGAPDLAAADARAAVAAAPDWHTGYVCLAQAQRQGGEAGEAWRTLQTALSFAPDLVAVWWEAAAVQTALGDKPAAFDAVSRTVELDPLHGPAWLRRARLALALGRQEAARRSLEAASRLLASGGEIETVRSAIERRFGREGV